MSQHPKEFEKVYFIYDKNDKVIAQVRVEGTRPFATIHVDIKEWSHNIYRGYLNIFTIIKKELVDSGFYQLFAVTDGLEDEKWDKLVRMFGFSTPVVTKTAIMEVHDE